MERKLTAILSTDVKGYSRLMGDDEEATILTLKTYREVISRLIEQHHGRVVDSPGDNMLAEFASAVDAVKAAVAIQQDLKTRNTELEDHRKMEFRIGLNVGDIITDEGRLYGDGVNIAARLEGLADPGGICISEAVHTQVRNKLSLQYEYIGEREVKNIADPVPVYKVQLTSGTPAAPRVSQRPAPAQSVQPRPASRRWSLVALAVVVVLVVGAGAVVIRNLYLQPTPALELPDKPSIAVLPFVNMSEDPGQEYFSDGITEDIITDLSKLSGLFVIARNSVFTYKGKAVKVEEVGRELGVRYVLEGSTRKADSRVRINAQLVDATTGGHLWAERYDRELKDIFALQDEITQRIVATLKVQLTLREQGVLARGRTTDSLEAYDSYLRGLEYYYRLTKEANSQARQLCEEAIELDPQYAKAHALLGRTYFKEWMYQWSPDPQALDQTLALAQQAIALDDALPMAHRLLSYSYLWKKQYVQAIAAGEQALVLDPNDADGYETLAEILSFAGRSEKALGLVQQATHLNPHYTFDYPFNFRSGLPLYRAI